MKNKKSLFTVLNNENKKSLFTVLNNEKQKVIIYGLK